MLTSNKTFKIISGSLLLGVAAASAFRLAFPPHQGITDAQARQGHYHDAREYDAMTEWVHSLHDWHFNSSQLAYAKNTLANGSPSARQNVMNILGAFAQRKPRDPRMVALFVSCAYNSDPTVRFLAGYKLKIFDDPQAKIALDYLNRQKTPENPPAAGR